MIKFIKFIKNLFKTEKRVDYPIDFAIVKFSEVAFDSGIKGDSNKIIERYYYDDDGNLKTKNYRYSQERAFTLRESGVPIFDKTEQELTFPVVGRIELGGIRFKTK